MTTEKIKLTLEKEKKDPNVHPIINNSEHLKLIVNEFGRYVFTNILVPNDVLAFINKTFIDNSFFYKGNELLGDKKENETKTFTYEEQTYYNNQRQTLLQFWNLFINNFTNDTVKDPIEFPGGIPIETTGGFGMVRPYYKIDGKSKPEQKIEGKIVKYITPGGADSGTFYIDINDYESDHYLWMVEFCSFVVVMSILMYIDCILLKNNKSKQICISEKFRNFFDSFNISDVIEKIKEKKWFLGYYSFMAKIDAPFVTTTTITKDNKKPKNKKVGDKTYFVGYIATKYDNTLYNLCSTTTNNKQTVIDAFSLIYQTIEIIKKFSYLYNLGIFFSHRDLTFKNIMYTTDLKTSKKYVKIIDFGFICSNILYEQENGVALGIYTPKYKELFSCKQRYHDIMTFLVSCIQNHHTFLKTIQTETQIDIESELKKIVGMNNNIVISKIYDKNFDYVDNLATYIEENKLEQFDEKGYKLNKLFDDVFKIMDRVKNKLQGVYTIDYDDTNEYNIADTKKDGDLNTFYNMYKKFKNSYIKLSKDSIWFDNEHKYLYSELNDNVDHICNIPKDLPKDYKNYNYYTGALDDIKKQATEFSFDEKTTIHYCDKI